MSEQISRITGRLSGAVLIGFAVRLVLSAPEDLPTPSSASSRGEVPKEGSVAASTQKTIASPGGATSSAKASYVGTNQCFTCHRPQTNTWSETKHAHSFADLPTEYQGNPGCIKCHVTGFGQPGGYVAGTDKDLLMVGCETCHGAGSLHVDAAKRFVLANLGEEAQVEKEMKETITKTPSDRVCVGCHLVQAHQKLPFSGRGVGTKVANGSETMVHSTPTIGVTYAFSRYSVKTCGGCHYDQYQQWRTGKHATLAAMLPAKYLNDQTCQTCHTDMPAAVRNVNAAGDPHYSWVGVTCELCHGPALQHIQFTKQFIDAPPLGPKLEQEARDSIRKGKPATTCIQCHVRQTHKQHPQYDRK